MNWLRSLLLPALLCLALPAAATPEDDVRAAFARFVAAQNAHDAAAVRALLSTEGGFLWVTRGHAMTDRDAAIARFEELYRGTWVLTPEPAPPSLVPVRADAYELYARVRFEMGPAGTLPTSRSFMLTQLWVREAGGWRLASLLPIPLDEAPAATH